jgi:N-terminal domain of toast_rack, DUF2154
MSERQERMGSGSVVFPLLLIGFGVLMLLWRWMPNFHPWHVLWRYWPLFFILIGAGMILDRTRQHQEQGEARPFPIGTAVGTLLFLLVIGYLLYHDHSYYPRELSADSTNRVHESKTVDLGGAKAVHMSVQMPAGELRIEGGAQQLFSGDFFHAGSWSVPDVDYSVDNGIGTLHVQQNGGGTHIGNSDNTWNLKVTDSTPLELKIDMGAGRGDFRLAKVDLTRLEVNIGAGQVTVDLTGERAKDLEATIQGGVGQAVVKLPKNIGVVATVHGGLGSVDVHGLTKDDERYVNAAYGKSPQTLRLTVEGGIGQIKLEQE